MLEKQYEELKLTGNLPSPNGVGLALLQVTQKTDASIDEVVAILQADPTLTGRILKMANSAALAVAQPATTVHEAAMRLGLRAVRNVGLGFSLLAGNRSGRCQSFDYDEYWSHSLATAVASQVVAERTGGVEPSEAFTCGLLSGIGRLALASVHTDSYHDVLERARGQTSARLSELETEAFDINHRELATAMLHDWKLPEAYALAVGLVGSGQNADELGRPDAVRLARVLQSARDISRAMTVPPDADASTCRKRLGELAAMCRTLGLDVHGFGSLWNRCVDEWKRWGAAMKVDAELKLQLESLRQRAMGTDDATRVEREAELSDTNVARVIAPDSAQGLRILLVNSDVMSTRLLSAHLTRDSHEVLTATHGEEALAKALELAPHVLVTEWDLPGISGLDLVRTLRRSDLGKRVHVILLAGRAEQQKILEAFESGVDEYLTKPCDPQVLQARVRAAQRVVRLNDQVRELLRERETQVSQLTIAKRKLSAAAITDALTGLPNRRYAMERLDQEVATALETGKPLSVIMIDIDKFKSVNDQHGHDVGDIVLREVADVLRSSVRRVDAPCRLGGEEFLIICPNTPMDKARMVAERLRTSSREHVVTTAGFNRSVTLSLGVAQFSIDEPTVDQLVKRSDERVYLAKEAGRDCVVWESSVTERRSGQSA